MYRWSFVVEFVPCGADCGGEKVVFEDRFGPGELWKLAQSRNFVLQQVYLTYGESPEADRFP